MNENVKIGIGCLRDVIILVALFGIILYLLGYIY